MISNNLAPNIDAIRKTNWSQLQFDKNNVLVFATLVALLLMLVSVFLNWFHLEVETWEDYEGSRMGITLWYGILGFILALIAAMGVLYNHNSLAFWATVICVVLAIIAMIDWPTVRLDDDLYSLIDKKSLEAHVDEYDNFEYEKGGRIGAILFLIGSVISAVCSYLLATGKKVKL